MEGDQAPVKVDSQFVSLILIRWIAIYPMDSAIHLLNNQGQVHPGSESGIGKDIGIDLYNRYHSTIVIG